MSARRRDRRLAGALLLGVLVAAAASAEAFLPRIGGDGGSDYAEPCPAGLNLTGFELRTGDDIDALRPVCLPSYSAAESGAQQVGTEAAWHGGPGGKPQRLLCPAQTPVVLGLRVEVEGVHTMTVNAIDLYCGRAVAEQSVAPDPAAVFEAPRAVSTRDFDGFLITDDMVHFFSRLQTCPVGQVAVGVHGRSGLYLDAMGLICDAPRIADRPPGTRPTVALGKVVPAGPDGPAPDVCDAAKGARARNSPAAASLEAQCTAAHPPKALGRVDTTGSPAMTVCEAAASARARNSPAAASLEKQCREQSAAPAPASPTAPPVIDEAWRTEQASRGAVLTGQDALAGELRGQWQNAEKLRAFDIGMAVAEGQTLWGPGKQAIRDALGESERRAFEIAVWYSIDRNANADLAAKGAAMADVDPTIAQARRVKADPFFRLGFDIASGLFGDPALGAVGNTAMGPGAQRIRNALMPEAAQAGFDAGAAFHLARKYR